MSIYASVSKPQHSPPWAAWWRLSLLITSIITQVVARASVIGTANSITGPASTAARFAGVMLSDLERAWNEQYLLHCWQPSKDINQLIKLKIYAMLPALAVATRRPLYFFLGFFLTLLSGFYQPQYSAVPSCYTYVIFLFDMLFTEINAAAAADILATSTTWRGFKPNRNFAMWISLNSPRPPKKINEGQETNLHHFAFSFRQKLPSFGIVKVYGLATLKQTYKALIILDYIWVIWRNLMELNRK